MRVERETRVRLCSLLHSSVLGCETLALSHLHQKALRVFRGGLFGIVRSMTIIETNLPDHKTTERLTKKLLEAHLIACANWWPIESRYRWKGRQIRNQEIRCVLKTTPDKATAALAWLIQHHPYDAPWLTHIELPSASESYTDWLKESVK